MKTLTLEDYYGNYEGEYHQELTRELRENASHTVNMASCLLSLFGEYRNVNSGWRPKAVNARIPNAAKLSKHLTC